MRNNLLANQPAAYMGPIMESPKHNNTKMILTKLDKVFGLVQYALLLLVLDYNLSYLPSKFTIVDSTSCIWK